MAWWPSQIICFWPKYPKLLIYDRLTVRTMLPYVRAFALTTFRPTKNQSWKFNHCCCKLKLAKALRIGLFHKNVLLVFLSPFFFSFLPSFTVFSLMNLLSNSPVPVLVVSSFTLSKTCELICFCLGPRETLVLIVVQQPLLKNFANGIHKRQNLFVHSEMLFWCKVKLCFVNQQKNTANVMASHPDRTSF